MFHLSNSIKLKSYMFQFSMKDIPIVVTELNPPFNIIFVNKSWERLCEYSFPDVVGKNLKLMQGPDTDIDMLKTLKLRLQECLQDPNTFNQRYFHQMLIINYKKSGSPFSNFLKFQLLYNNNNSPIAFAAESHEIKP